MSTKILSAKSSVKHIIKFYSLLVKVLVSAGLITFILIKVNLADSLKALINSNLLLIIVCLLIMPVNLLLQYIKWKITAEKILGDTTKREIIYSLFLGLSAGAFTPARLGEYWGRSYILKEKSFSRVTAASILDKIYPLIIILSSGIPASILFLIYNPSSNISGNEVLIYLVIALIITITAVVLIFNFKKLIKIIQKLPWAYKQESLLNVLGEVDSGFSIRMFLISAIYCGSYLFQYALLTSAFSGNYTIGIYIWVGILVMFSKTLFSPVSISELGIREGASVYFMTALGEAGAAGFNAAIFLFLINVILPSLPGLYILLKRNDGN